MGKHAFRIGRKSILIVPCVFVSAHLLVITPDSGMRLAGSLSEGLRYASIINLLEGNE